MRRFWTIVGGVVALAAMLVLPAGARVQVASGDTCTASGNGSQYTLRINIPGGGQQQYGFAVRADGGTVTNISIPGANGNFSTAVASLAPNTTAGWFSDAPLPANAVVTIATSGTLKSLTIVPSFNASAVNGGSTPATGQTQPTTGAPSFLDPVTCTMSATAPARTASLTVAPRATWSSSSRAWKLAVTVPNAGIVSAKQLMWTSTGAYGTGVVAKPFVQAHRVSAKAPGSVTLTLKPTPRGQAALETSGSFTVPLQVTFDAGSGKAAHRNVTLTLRA